MGAKDYKLAAEKAEEAKERGTRIYRDRARTILGSSEELANLARGVGGDVSEADAALRRSRDALDSDDVTGAIDHAKKAWKRSEKVLLEHLSSSFSKAQALILSAKNLGRDVGPVEDLLSRARSAMEGSDFPAALGFTQEGLETITEDLKSVLERRSRRRRTSFARPRSSGPTRRGPRTSSSGRGGTSRTSSSRRPGTPSSRAAGSPRRPSRRPSRGRSRTSPSSSRTGGTSGRTRPPRRDTSPGRRPSSASGTSRRAGRPRSRGSRPSSRPSSSGSSRRSRPPGRSSWPP